MEYRRMGSSELMVSAIGFGCWELGGTNYAPALRSPAGSAGPAGAELPDSAFIGLPVPTGHGDSTDRAWRGVVTRDGWKYVCLEGQPWLLFDLNEDPYELVNLAHNTRYRAKRGALHARLARWLEETGDSFALPVCEAG